MIGETLLVAAVRGSIILIVAGIAVTLLRSRPAALRHTIWSLGIASQLALPIVALMMPQRTIDLGPIGAGVTRVVTRFAGGEAGGGRGEAGKSIPVDQSNATAAGSARAADQPTGSARRAGQPGSA